MNQPPPLPDEPTRPLGPSMDPLEEADRRPLYNEPWFIPAALGAAIAAGGLAGALLAAGGGATTTTTTLGVLSAPPPATTTATTPPVGDEPSPEPTTTAAPSTTTNPVTTTTAGAGSPATTVAPTTTLAPTTSPKTYAEGTYAVGTQIPPGTYRTDGDDERCGWARIHQDGSAGRSVTDHDSFVGPARMTVQASDTSIEFSGACVWQETD